MAKTVLTNDMVRHVWAQGTQYSGRNAGGSFWFQGDTLYSYRTPIARRIRILDNPECDWVFLISADRYFTTTASKHMSGLYQAVNRSRVAIFTVKFLGRFGGKRQEPNRDSDEMQQVHADNVAAMITDYQSNLASLRRARLEPLGYQYEGLAEAAQRIRTYALLFAVPGIVFPHPDDDEAELREFWRAKLAKQNSPEAIAKRERAALRRETAKLRAAEKEAEQEREAIQKWRDDGKSYPSYLPYTVPVMLRLKPGNPDVIETSRGAEFPTMHGRLAWPVIKRCRDTATLWAPNGHSVHLGSFAVAQIDAEGNVTAGCHYVLFAEIERMARLLGLIEGVSDNEHLGSEAVT